MKAHCRAPRRSGFTLVEMLTVIAIITLLIGILVPSLSAARTAATRTAVSAQLNAISTGCEMFRNDEGQYPASNPFTFGPYGQLAAQNTAINNWEVNNLTGAHLIVDAMVGRDFLGYDPKAGLGPGAAVDSRWYAGAVPAGQFPRARRNAYIRPEGIASATADKPPQDAFGTYDPSAVPNPYLPRVDAADTTVPVFVDKFGFPVLYYRANPRTNQSTPIIQSPAGVPVDPNVGDGVYDGRDNALFTSPVGRQHRISDANVASYLYNPGTAQFLDNNFAEFIRSFRASSYVAGSNPPIIQYPRPVNSESFILLSAGKDGIFGNLDDVANFAVLSEER